MSRLWLDVEAVRQLCPSRQFFKDHAWSIGLGMAALALWAAYPILTIPVFGIALPLGAGWLLVRSMMEDRQLASERARMESATIGALRRAIEEKTIVSLPVRTRDRIVDTPVRITRVDERGVDATDPNRRISTLYSWSRIDIEKLYRSLEAPSIEPNIPESSLAADDKNVVVGWFGAVKRRSDRVAPETSERGIFGAAANFVKSLRGNRSSISGSD
ncbi:MAG: hypothetical protein WB816_18285 [Methylocystis sp.]